MESPLKVADFLASTSVADNLVARDKEGVLSELVAILVKSGAISDGARALNVLLEREKLGSTGMNEGAAIPHGRLPELKSIVAAFGRSRKGIPFGSLDGEPVDAVFLLFSPESMAGLHLKALARISRLLKNRQFRKELLDASSADEIYALFVEGDTGQ